MAQLVWREPALNDLDEIAEYIALDNPSAAANYVQKVFDRVDRLATYPNSGKRPAELHRTPYREIVVPPCRIFYRVENNGSSAEPVGKCLPGGTFPACATISSALRCEDTTKTLSASP